MKKIVKYFIISFVISSITFLIFNYDFYCFAQMGAGASDDFSAGGEDDAMMEEDFGSEDMGMESGGEMGMEGEISGGAESEPSKQVQEKEIVEIKEIESSPQSKYYSMELRNVDLKDLIRILAHDYKLNIIMDKNISGEVTASFKEVTLNEALDSILYTHGYALKKEGNILRVTKDLITRIFTLNSIEANTLVESSSSSSSSGGSGGDMSGGMGTGSSGGMSGMESGMSDTGGMSTGSSSSSNKKVSTILDLLSSDGRILLGNKPNSIMIIDYPKNVKSISEYIQMADKGVITKIFYLKYIRADELLGVAEEDSSSSDSDSSTSSSTEAD